MTEEEVGGLIGLLIFLGAYLLPTIIAVARSRPNTFAIFLLNLFLGATGVGWVIALVWACTTTTIER